jgi:hypothetical protein
MKGQRKSPPYFQDMRSSQGHPNQALIDDLQTIK